MNTITLKPHQQEALEKLHNGSILNGGTGSGKSITGLSYYLNKEYPKDLYIITIAKKRDSGEWEDELIAMSINISYKTNVVIDSWNNIRKYENVENAFFIFDEQRAVGGGSWARTFIKIARKNSWIMLTATPGDTWLDYIPVFIANGFYKNKSEFINRHVIFNPYVKFPQVKKYLDVETLIKHREDILVTMIFEMPTQCHEETIIIPFDEIAYKEMTEKRWNPEKNKPVRNIAELCQWWRKISGANTDREEQVCNLITKHNSAIVFYNFTWELERLKACLERRKIPYSEWNGQKHQPIPDGKHWAYLMQYAAGSEAWNCTLTNCIIFYSLNYSWKVMTQAKGRINRLNTPFKDLYYYRFRSNSDIDKAIERALSRKKKFNETKFIKESEGYNYEILQQACNKTRVIEVNAEGYR